ncbi:unnamed protein product (macronuclear) [Paramecium tetraurelia]|uniref:Trichocyst matrix protein n=2 Tax=Paramecium TaxID=5884 RepID=A0CFM6_PARTE|nr:uncharacterized protein GSPATT00038033001 [Paramecium tetraurelia]CAD8188168.1 unnamed protein product [Paramecium octaurelia]CAK69593.1 unnamed protein product [Paramecium tetraurelia]|eukprot:XP_001436990.1 hypothetical protein (macronuclear) [Paramecium tetraurelia strain d4-2]
MKVIAVTLVLLLAGKALAGDLTNRYPIIGKSKPTLVSILTELESKLSSGGSIDTAVNFLSNLRASIDSEQIRHDQLYTDQRNQCNAELELRTKDVKDAEQVLNRATEQYENCSTSKKKADAELDNNLDSQKATDTDIKILDSIRQAGATNYNAKKQDHIDALRSIQESLKILDSFQSGGASLAQMSEISLRMIQDAVKLKTTNIMSQISSIFAQMLTQNGGYIEVFERLKQLLQNLEQNLYTNLQKISEEEDQSIQEYDDRRVHLVEYYNNLKRTENKLRDHITTMDICQDQQSAIIDSARGKKVRNGEIFDSATRMCNDFASEYEKATQVRKQELELVDKVKAKIIERGS